MLFFLPSEHPSWSECIQEGHKKNKTYSRLVFEPQGPSAFVQQHSTDDKAKLRKLKHTRSELNPHFTRPALAGRDNLATCWLDFVI